MPPSSRPWSPARSALLVTLVYAAVSGVWIALSDEWVARLFSDPRELTLAQTLKGWFFVLASSVLIFVLVRHAIRKARAERRADMHLQKVLDTLPGSVFWMDRELRFAGCNAHFAREAGLNEPGQIRGLRPGDLPWQPPCCRSAAEHEGGVVRTGEPLLRREESSEDPEGRPRWEEVSRVPLVDGSGTIVGVLTLAQDVTARRVAEAQLRHVQKLQTIGDVTSGVAHDFKNALAVIRANADFLLEGDSDREEARAALSDIRGVALGATGVVRNLLSLGRRRDLAPAPTDMGELVRGLAPMFSRLLTATYRFDVVVDPGLPPALADPVSVEQALLNILTNARDAMPDGGEVRLSAELRELEAPLAAGKGCLVSAHPLEPGPYVVLAVRDGGSGMDDRVLSAALDPFFTTKPPGEGSGLGLPMVDDLMREHGGGLQVASAPGEGTTVRLFFPAAPSPGSPEGHDPAMETAREGEEGGQVATSATGTVLVVEDQVELRRTVARVLERRGYRVILAADGKEGLEVFLERESEIDLVLADLIMPRMGGLALYEAIRERDDRIPVVLTSGLDAAEEGEAHRKGVADLPMIPKPWTADELLRGIAAAMARASADRPTDPVG